jgi:prepilin-type N-terminal cleavage/methylation domain-containing protein
MPPLSRQGVTLVELLVGLALLGIVSLGIHRVFVGNQRIYLAQTQRIDLHQNIRAALTILPAEFRELNAVEGDIAAMSATSITIRAMRQFAIVCARPVLGGVAAALMIRVSPFYGMRDFNPDGDSIFVYYEGDPLSREDDGWVRGRIHTVGAASETCTDAGVNSGLVLTTSLAWGTVQRPDGVVLNQLNRTGNIDVGAPVRGWETVTYRLYRAADGRWYIGQQTTNGGGIQPLVGPVRADGLTLSYFDSTGAATTAVNRVFTIGITVRADTEEPRRAAESVSTHVALRNNPRF